MMHLTLLFQVREGIATIIMEIEIVDMVANVVAEEVVKVPYNNVNPLKDNSMIKCYFCGKYEHYVVECYKKKCDEEANLTLTQDQEPTLMLA